MHVPGFLPKVTISLAFLLIFGATQSVASVAYYHPTQGGGSMLINANDGYGEPLNTIISGESSPDVLTDNGFLDYARAIGFSKECLGFHLGTPCSANLGDGNGWVNQTMELRQDFGDPDTGTCLESLNGGNHFRMFPQNGPKADSKALFLAVSKEKPVAKHHHIVPDGYDVGRDNLVTGAVGQTSFRGVTYETRVQKVTGLLKPGSQGVNHGIAQDGGVTVLTVTIV